MPSTYAIEKSNTYKNTTKQRNTGNKQHIKNKQQKATTMQEQTAAPRQHENNKQQQTAANTRQDRDDNTNTTKAERLRGRCHPVSPLSPPASSYPTAIGPTHPQDLPRRGLFSHHFSFPFLTQLDPPKASQNDPFWRPKSTQDLPKTRLETTLLQKRRFSKYEPRPRREHDFDPPGLPRRDQDRPKIAPRPS